MLLPYNPTAQALREDIIVMRAKHPERQPRHASHVAHGYPTPSDKHPTYMFGHFDRNAALDSGGGLDEAILGIREGSGSTEVAGHQHHHLRGYGPSAMAAESLAFMFGVDPVHPQAMSSGEPRYYFWAAGSS
jgi:hypothetical protein